MCERLLQDAAVNKDLVRIVKVKPKGRGDGYLGKMVRKPVAPVVRCQHLWSMLYADDAGIMSRSPEGLAKMMTAIVEMC